MGKHTSASALHACRHGDLRLHGHSGGMGLTETEMDGERTLHYTET